MGVFSWMVQQDQGPLFPLDCIIRSMQGERFYIGSKDNEINETDPETFNAQNMAVFQKKTTPELPRLRSNIQEWRELRPHLINLYAYLQENPTQYTTRYQKNISQQTSNMVKKLDAYLVQKNAKIKNEEKEKRLLNKAQKARQAFYDAFEFSQTKNAILTGIVGAIMGVIAGFFGRPGVLAGAAIGSTAGISFIGIRKKLLIGNPSPLQPLANLIFKEVGNKLPVAPEPLPIGNSFHNHRPIDPTKIRIKHEELESKSKISEKKRRSVWSSSR